jgi:predicted Zn-dependent protease
MLTALLLSIRCTARSLPSLFLATFLLALTGCATTGVNRGDVNLISLDQEWQLGQQLERDLQGQLTLVHDRAALNYINRMGQRIVQQTEMRNRPWEFHIVRDPSVNAFNTPGGHVYVHTGLIDAAGSASELAGVMAHEIAHGVARHGTEQLTKAYGANLAAGALLGSDPAVYEQLLTQVVAGGAFAKFSRGAEREADELGVRYLYDAGYDPMGMPRMFERLLAQRERRPGAVAQFFSSHPLTESRIRATRRQAQRLPDRGGLITNDAGFNDLRRRL